MTDRTTATDDASLRSRRDTRTQELDPGDRARDGVEQALSEVEGRLTGAVGQIPRVVATELSTSLEANQRGNPSHRIHGHPATRSAGAER